MDIGSATSLRRRTIELQKTLKDIGVNSRPILHDEATARDHRGPATDDVFVVVTPTETVRLPYQDFLNWEETGQSEIRTLPCYNRTLTKKLAYWISGHATVPILLAPGVLEWRAEELPEPSGTLQAGHFTLPSQIKLTDSSPFLAAESEDERDGGGTSAGKGICGLLRDGGLRGNSVLPALPDTADY